MQSQDSKSFAGSSRPASGSEHHLSHFFEIVGIINSEPYLAHGTDVAYSTVITAKIREKLSQISFPTKRFTLDRDTYTKKMKEVYKSVADGCIALQDKVGNYANDRTEIYKAKDLKDRYTVLWLNYDLTEKEQELL